MDYREKIEVLNWHANYSKLNGVESRVLTLLVHGANYKTGLVSFSYGDLVDRVDACKLSVSKAFKQLLSIDAIAITKEFGGRGSFNYKVRGIDDLNIIYLHENNNKIYEEWFAEKEKLHDEVLNKLMDVEYETESCEDCLASESKVCEMHKYKINRVKDSEGYRKYSLWLSDNPEPVRKIKTIKGKVVID